MGASSSRYPLVHIVMYLGGGLQLIFLECLLYLLFLPISDLFAVRLDLNLDLVLDVEFEHLLLDLGVDDLGPLPRGSDLYDLVIVEFIL
jgi:hypothetical protein